MPFIIQGYDEKGLRVTCSKCMGDQIISVDKLSEQSIQDIDCIYCDRVCITCRRKFITKECDTTDREKCKKCEYNKCENCTQYGNLDCDGDIIVPPSSIRYIPKDEDNMLKDIKIGSVFRFNSSYYLRINPIESIFVKMPTDSITALNLKTFNVEVIFITTNTKND